MSTTIIIHDKEGDLLPFNDNVWNNLISAFDIPHIYKVGGDQINGFVQYGPEHSIPNKKVCVLNPIEAAAYDIEPTLLHNYVHPSDCAYVFGPDDSVKGWQSQFDSPDTDYITIQTPNNTELWSYVAATIVLWHRYNTLGV